MGYPIDRGFGYHESPRPESVEDLAEEMVRAREKFPGNDHLTVALGEEYGELCQAQLQRKGREQIRKEALQVACIAMRIYEEGDASLSAVTDAQALA